MEINKLLNLKKNLEENIGSLPIYIPKDDEYKEKLEDIFKEYINCINSANISQIAIEKLKKICDILINTIEKYYEGSISCAIETIEKLFEEKKLGDYLFTYNLKKKSDNGTGDLLFRGRIGRNIYNLSEMFHVPFNERQYVATGRYSISGFPCLYLSSSIYGCWLELDKPQVEEFYISRYEAKKDLTLLDLSWTFKEVIEDELGQNQNSVVDMKKYIYTWPLICACSFVVGEKNRKFKSEYIIPQLLVQVIRNLNIGSNKINIDGIKYFSSRLKYSKMMRPKEICDNYIFIPNNNTLKYFNVGINKYSTKLQNEFKLTPPANVRMCMEVKNIGKTSLILDNNILCNKTNDIKMKASRGKERIELMKGVYVEYSMLDFFKIEELLCKIPAENLKKE